MDGSSTWAHAATAINGRSIAFWHLSAMECPAELLKAFLMC